VQECHVAECHSERGEVGVDLRSDGHRFGCAPTIIAHVINRFMKVEVGTPARAPRSPSGAEHLWERSVIGANVIE
jgi:hypothetical protein